MHEDDVFILKFKLKVYFKSYSMPLVFIAAFAALVVLVWFSTVAASGKVETSIMQEFGDGESSSHETVGLPALPYADLRPLEKFGMSRNKNE